MTSRKRMGCPAGSTHGYMTLEFDEDEWFEIVHGAGGTRLRTQAADKDD